LNALVLFVAQGLGLGRLPKAPGTFGTLLGFPWFAVMVAITGAVNRGIGTFIVLLLVSVVASVWICGRAEKILGVTDPGSVVLDEIVAIPVCYVPWLLSVLRTDRHHHARIDDFFNLSTIFSSALIFALFRVFDIWKPWPIRQLQRLPGGWGVTVDDLVAAGYVALITIPFVR
jgi:phosphatidylglycerophosphatase A